MFKIGGWKKNLGCKNFSSKNSRSKNSTLFNYFVKKTVNFPFSAWNLGIPMELSWEMKLEGLNFINERSELIKESRKFHFPTKFHGNTKIESGRREIHWFCRQNNWTDCFFLFLLFFRNSIPGISLKVACTSHFVSYNLNSNKFSLILYYFRGKMMNP